MIRHKFSGPPGTGKSTTMLNVVDSLLTEGTAPEDIVYTTFSRAGAYEARDRACERFKLSVNRLPNFKTLHSLCFSLLPKTDVMGFVDWGIIGRTVGTPIRLRGSEDNNTFGLSKGERLINIWSLSRMRMEPVSKTFENAERGYSGQHRVSLAELEHFVSTVNNYKSQFGKIDFTDMLTQWLDSGLDVHANYVIVDEAQDLSALQWKVVDKICANARSVWIAGDDDQCIHEWNGASPQHFIELSAQHYEVLAQSHRIPASVHNLAEKIIAQVKTRLPKTYRPREDAGRVIRLADMGSLDLKSGSWLLLARNKTYLKDYVEMCRQKGVRYVINGEESELDNQVMQAIASWKRLQQLTKDITAARAKSMYEYMSRRDRVANGFKMKLNAVSDHQMLTYEDLVKDYGLLAIRNQPWWTALDEIAPQHVPTLKELERTGELLNEVARIHISTIHGAKGQEADNVVLRPDMSPQTQNGYLDSPDNEHRVWYVAVTRARQNLYLLTPTESAAYPI